MLKVESLNQYYGSSQTLRDIAFNVPSGACTVLLGRNGVISAHRSLLLNDLARGVDPRDLAETRAGHPLALRVDVAVEVRHVSAPL